MSATTTIRWHPGTFSLSLGDTSQAFDMTTAEQADVLRLLNEAQRLIQRDHSPDGYNIGANIGEAAGQSRMHVHLHLISRYLGDVSDPRGGIRCVLARRVYKT